MISIEAGPKLTGPCRGFNAASLTFAKIIQASKKE